MNCDEARATSVVAVVDEAQVGPQVLRAGALADAVEHVRPRRQPGIRGRLGQDRWQKLWKLLTDIRAAVATPTASSIRAAQLGRRLDVVGQDEELLGEEVLAASRAATARARR